MQQTFIGSCVNYIPSKSEEEWFCEFCMEKNLKKVSLDTENHATGTVLAPKRLECVHFFV